MLSFIARLNLALVLVWTIASHAAVIEIEHPTSRPGLAPNAGLLHWQVMSRGIGFADEILNPMASRKSAGTADPTGLVHVANASVPRADADEIFLQQEYYWRSGNGATEKPGSFEESMQQTEVWPILVIALGLIAYQLRRQTRSRSGMVRIMSNRP